MTTANDVTDTFQRHCEIHRNHAAWISSLDLSGVHSCSVCGGVALRGDHELCKVRNTRGGLVPQINAPLACPCNEAECISARTSERAS